MGLKRALKAQAVFHGLEKLKVRKVCPIVPAVPLVKMPLLPGEMHSALEVERA